MVNFKVRDKKEKGFSEVWLSEDEDEGGIDLYIDDGDGGVGILTIQKDGTLFLWHGVSSEGIKTGSDYRIKLSDQ